MTLNMGRRRFVTKATRLTAAAIGFPYIVSSKALGTNAQTAAGERITVGCIGAGPQGCAVMRGFLSQSDAQVVAVCDVKTDRLDIAGKLVEQTYQHKGCARYGDWRQVMGRSDIDAVVIATPDHWHVPIAMSAARAGKDMYVEKPLGMSVYEAQVLRATIKKYGRVFQFGTQQRSDANFRFACELVRNGRIGRLRTINVWSPGSVAGGSTVPAPVPAGIDYQMWLGPAPFSPYTADRCSEKADKKTWWYHSDFSHGFLAGWGIHPMDIGLWGGGSDLGGVIEIEGQGTFPTEGACDTATKWDVVFRYGNGIVLNFKGLEIKSNDSAVLNVSAFGPRYGRTTFHGTAFEGSEGWVHVDRSGINAYPKSLLSTTFGPDEISLYRSTDHVRNFLDCVKIRAGTICDIESSVRSEIACHISNLCLKLGRKVVWDSQKECFINDQAANRMLHKPIRSPWHL